MKKKAKLLRSKINKLYSRKITHKTPFFTVEINWVWEEDEYPTRKDFKVVATNKATDKFFEACHGIIHKKVVIDNLLSNYFEANHKSIFNKEFKAYCKEIQDLCYSSEFSDQDWVDYQLGRNN